MIERFKDNPKLVFRIDAAGALLSCLSLFAIRWFLSPYFGMPNLTVFYLSLAALGMFLYSASCYLFIRSNWKRFLGIIIISNSIYAIISFAQVICHSSTLTGFGWTYFILEIFIIGIIVHIELSTYLQLD